MKRDVEENIDEDFILEFYYWHVRVPVSSYGSNLKIWLIEAYIKELSLFFINRKEIGYEEQTHF